MRTRRVGTISMAIVLIAFGLLLFIAQFSKIAAIDIIIKVWPMILILIGIEILYFVHKNKDKDNNFTIRYDIFSMFIVFVILIINIGIYGLMETGVMDYIKLRVSEEIRYEIDIRESYNR